MLDPDVVYLNHGAFGAMPSAVHDVQERLRRTMEADPVRFLADELEARLDPARAALAAFVGADPADLAFVSNATSAVSSVLRSLRLDPGDELLTTSHTYNACRNALDWVAERTGARVVVAAVPFPLTAEDQVIEAVLGAVSDRTRLALLDHVTSPTGLIFPIRRLCAALEAADVDVLVDGAHAPGMVPLDLATLGAAYYTGNCHKWMCAPRGAGFLVARGDRHDGLVPAVLSHGRNALRPERSRFHLDFDWIGSLDPTPWLCVPEALAVVGGMLPGGWPAIYERNRGLALEARAILGDALGVTPAAPASMIGSLVAFPIGPGDPAALRRRLIAAGFQLPVYTFGGERVLRVSAAIYNERADYERLAATLTTLRAG